MQLAFRTTLRYRMKNEMKNYVLTVVVCFGCCRSTYVICFCFNFFYIGLYGRSSVIPNYGSIFMRVCVWNREYTVSFLHFCSLCDSFRKMAQRSMKKFFKSEIKVSKPVQQKDSNFNDIFRSAVKRKHSELDSFDQPIHSNSNHDIGPASNGRNSQNETIEKLKCENTGLVEENLRLNEQLMLQSQDSVRDFLHVYCSISAYIFVFVPIGSYNSEYERRIRIIEQQIQSHEERPS